ncbi:acetyl-CoA C-acyltransferase, partial [Candidatus Poribacteria bacterium]|nr:acetyl-CoA C-acyltransferase [Candidatus Poribacteria bacterium]
MKLREPIGLVGLCRSPIGKLGGVLAGFEAYELLAASLRATLACVPSAPQPGEVIVGNLRNSIGNVARVAALHAGLPVETPAITVDRQCASSMEALGLAAAKLGIGLHDCILVGGVESASRSPWLFEKTARPFASAEPKPYRVRMATDEAGDPPMGETAEMLADEFGITRREMDEFAIHSHQKATAARDALANESSAVAA